MIAFSFLKKISSFLIIWGLLSAVYGSDTYYVSVTTAKVRSCPKTSCKVVVKLDKGTTIAVVEEVKGDRISRSTVWYRISINEQDGYIHRSMVSKVDPDASATSRNASHAPKSCAEAREMGLTAEQAAQYPGLDRDHDGKACYGT